MPIAQRNANPFAMMLDPQAVLARVEHSERLSRLQRRVCRPLDKPMLGRAGTAADLAAFDSEVDGELDGEVDDSLASADPSAGDDRSA